MHNSLCIRKSYLLNHDLQQNKPVQQQHFNHLVCWPCLRTILRRRNTCGFYLFDRSATPGLAQARSPEVPLHMNLQYKCSLSCATGVERDHVVEDLLAISHGLED